MRQDVSQRFTSLEESALAKAINGISPSSPVIIGLITFRRPRMLSALLASLNDMEFGGMEGAIAIAVVDNDKDGTSREVVSSWAKQAAIPISYEIEPRQGIPFARNRLLAIARERNSRFIAMVDDDTQTRPDWLIQLFKALTEKGAVAACGAVRFVAEIEIKDNRIAQAVLDAHYTKKPLRAFLSTRCCLLNREFLDNHALEFDERFALTGGSDANLFARIQAIGGRIARVNEPLVVETIPPSRLTFAWRFRRSARVSAFRICSARRERGLFIALLFAAPEAVIKLLLGVVQILMTPVTGAPGMLKAMKKLGSVYGLVLGLAGVIPEEYKTVHGD